MERRIAKQFAPIACVAGIGLVVAGCASAGAQHETAAMPATPATSVIALPVAAATATPTPVAPVPVTAAPVTAAPGTAIPVPPVPAAMKTDAVAPHFDTPEAAMRYLVAAYNANNETNIRHVTTPDSRDQFETERQWVKAFRFRDCTPNAAPSWDYTCVLDIVTTMPGVHVQGVQAATDPSGNQIMDEVTVLVAPAARPGYYLEANEGCGGG